jgi:isopentenyl diphosphate isomerase/L-lactate dehydrogenase-like FMN-dependent dehydrogenase
MLTWDVIDWLRARTSLPLVLKGIVTAEDATMAASAGVEGIIVSNHGGRQLDSTMPTIAALPEVLEAVHGRCEVYVDGGIRRGTDVLKALALGARAVLVGRPVIWGLAVGGAAGVQDVLHILQTELALAMRLAGRTHVQSVDRSLVVSHAQWMGALAHATDMGRSADPDRRPTYSSALGEASRRRERAHSSQRKVVRRARR